ncbi:MAG: tetratricopeptide repeat protein [Bacteroidota bacterium]
MKYSIKIALFLIILFPFLLNAQKDEKAEKEFIKKGNDLYKSKKFNDAEINYRKSLEKNKNSFIGNYNLGDALYKQGQYEKATEKFNELTNQNTSKENISKSYHNLGNSLLQEKKYAESIDAYKKSLRQNPKDYDTKYNLEYARKMLVQEQQQNQKDQKNQKNQQNQKQQQQQQNKDQNKDNKDKKDNQNQQQQQQNQDKKGQNKQQQQQPKISKEDAKRMLQQIDNEEKNTQKKQKHKVVRGSKGRPEKPW